MSIYNIYLCVYIYKHKQLTNAIIDAFDVIIFFMSCLFDFLIICLCLLACLLVVLLVSVSLLSLNLFVSCFASCLFPFFGHGRVHKTLA